MKLCLSQAFLLRNFSFSTVMCDNIVFVNSRLCRLKADDHSESLIGVTGYVNINSWPKFICDMNENVFFEN